MEREAKEILKSIHSHNKAFGGHFIEITAGTGKGKTAMLLSTASYNLEHFPDERTFFSECFDTPIQVLKLGIDVVHILIPEKNKDDITFRDRDKALKLVPHDFFNVSYYKDFQDLYERAVPGKINVPFFIDRRDVMEFIAHLRSIGTFNTFLIDEMSEIATSMGHNMYRRNENFAFTCKDLRKCLCNVWYTAQNTSQVDWRVRSAIDIKIFGPASKADKHSRITQKAIDNLVVNKKTGNEYWISDGGVFGLFRLGDVYEPKEGLNIEAHCRAIPTN